jgi:hypothetical protein
MDQTTLTTSPELPKSQENLVPLKGEEIMAGAPLEKLDLASQPERLSSANSAVSQVIQDSQSQTTPQMVQDNAQADDNTTVSAQSSSSLIADDVDVIEKIWVQKAKTIVNETKDDPRKQSTELSNMKRDYIKKRFNKDIKPPNG